MTAADGETWGLAEFAGAATIPAARAPAVAAIASLRPHVMSGIVIIFFLDLG
ncbi:hypothetical protein [Nonomuraea indica]|uniref:Uncharacterized protein n=1 Tax=Nonomuraea indica TaxID=1581193 RepID=A0ABW7ZXP4_9ACTN|nr:hypothetical protein [Nonomuraea indica]